MTQSLPKGWISFHPETHNWSLFVPSGFLHTPSPSNEPFLTIGKWREKVSIVEGKPEKGLISTSIYLKNTHGEIKLGPLLGILTVEGRKTFKGIRSNFIDLIETGRKMGAFIYVVPIENIKWDKKEVTGYLYYPEKKKWVKECLPFPQVLYNRIPSRKCEEPEHVQHALKKLASSKEIHLFNPHFFNKASLFEILKKNSSVRPFLPETRVFRKNKDLKYMLEKYPFVYLKPLDGMAGKGIFRLEQMGEGFLLKFQQGKDIIHRNFKNKSEAFDFFKEACQVPYLVQQGIELAKYEEKIFDFRLLMQKNKRGDWELTGVGIRQSGEGNITTHVPRGGSVQSPMEILPLVFPSSSPASILQRLERISFTITKALEENWPALGEISMDIGIDRKGHLWFFEANSKPGKFDEPDIRKRSLENLINYARCLTHF